MAPAVFHILIALADQPMHGYGIMLDISERSDGKVKMSPGTLYGSIKQMLEDGLIEETESRTAATDDERRQVLPADPRRARGRAAGDGTDGRAARSGPRDQPAIQRGVRR